MVPILVTEKLKLKMIKKVLSFQLVKGTDEGQMQVYMTPSAFSLIMPTLYKLNIGITVLTSNSGQNVKTKVSPVP